MADSTGNLSGSGRLRRPVWATPPKPLQSLDDPLLRGEALISPTVVSSHAQLPGLPKQPNFPKSASVPAFPAAEKRSPLQPLEHRPSTSAGSDVSVPSRGSIRSSCGPRRKWAQPLAEFDRTLSKDFQGQIQMELSSLEDEQASLTLSDAPPLDQGLSYPARKENFKKEQFFLRFESVQHARSGSAGGTTSANDGSEAFEAEELVDQEVFLKDLADVDHHIQDLARSILFQHLERASMEERAAAKAEEARRRREAELRRARKKEQMARDPKRKVALKIENKRRFSGHEEDEPDAKQGKDTIPLRKYEVYGESGSEKVNIVDILKIQSQCEMLNESGGVDRMLDARHHSEKLRRALTFTDPGDRNSETSLFPSDISPDLPRDERAKQLRKDKYLNQLIDKMSTLRSEWKYMLPFDLDLASSGFVDAHGQRISVSNLIARNPRAAQKFLKELSSLIGQRIQAYGGRRGGIVGGYTLLESLGSKDPVSSKDTPDPVQRMMSKKKSQKDLQRSDTQRAISRKRWSIVKALTQWLLLWFRRRRLHTSANICVMVLRQMGEWSRIRSAMKGFVDNVTLLQRWCKRFLTVKRRRCGLCEKEWERFEDFHLSHFFRNKAQAIIQEQKDLAATEAMGGQGKRQYKGLQSGKAKRDKQAFLNLLEAGVEGGEISIDFRAYKIPPAERRAIINRWYMVTLRNHVRSEQTIALTIKEMLAAERELERFVSTFGCRTVVQVAPTIEEEVDDRGRKIAKKGQLSDDDMWQLRIGAKLKHEWYRVTEEFVIRCIAVAAQAMAQMAPFQDHPANRGLTTRPAAVPYDGEEDKRVFATKVVRAAARPCDLGRLGTKSLQVRASKARRLDEESITSKPKGHVEPNRRSSVNETVAGKLPTSSQDIEDVLKQLTPRLRQISEAQNLEYRLGKSKEDKEEKFDAEG